MSTVITSIARRNGTLFSRQASHCLPTRVSGFWNRGQPAVSLRHKSVSSFRNPRRGKPKMSNKPPPFSTTAGPSLRKSSCERHKSTLASSIGGASRVAQQQEEALVRQSVREALEEIIRKSRTLPIPRWISPQHHTISLSELYGHASFVLVAMSYAVDDFLMLRIIAVAGSTSMLVFTYFHPHGRVLWLPFKWNCLFIAINSYRIGKVFLNRYMAERLSPELLEFRRNNFHLMDPVDYFRWVRSGTMKDLRAGEVLVAQGECNRYVRVVLRGRLRVLRDGKLTYLLEEGNFISESGLHAGLLIPGSVESCCTIVADSDARVLTWDRTELIEMLMRYPSLRRMLKVVLSWDIMRKLKAQRTLIVNGDIDDLEKWTDRRNRQTFHRYTAILQAILSRPAYLNERRPELNKYRKIHLIDDEHHKMSLREIGWTPEEFEVGQREKHRDRGGLLGSKHDDGHEDEESEDDLETKHDWKWRVNDLLVRIFG